MSKEITGVLKTKRDVFFFRENPNEEGYLGWSIYDKSHRPKVYKWDILPKGEVEIFDSENPPPTVRFIPEIT